MDTCGVCGDGIIPTHKGQRFCSRACYSKSLVGTKRPNLLRRVLVPCQACGEPFEAGGRTGKKIGTTKFCSRSCAQSARWRTGSRAVLMTIEQKCYLAGLIDGEGCVLLYRRGDGAALRLVVTNTYVEALDWCSESTGVGSRVDFRSGNVKHKARHHWQANAQAAETVIEQILPYLIIKKRQAELALDFQRRLRIPSDKADKAWQEEYRLRMCALNKRGPAMQ